MVRSSDYAVQRCLAIVRLVRAFAYPLRQQIDGFKDLAAALGLSRKYAADLLRISYLAPDIIAAIIDGLQPASLTRTRLIEAPNVPLVWDSQRVALGFA